MPPLRFTTGVLFAFLSRLVTDLLATLSHKRWIRQDPPRDPADTLTPDIPTVRTAADVCKGRDPVIEKLREGR